MENGEVFAFFALWTFPEEFLALIKFRGRFQIIELLLRHHVRAADRAKMRMLREAVGHQQISELDHKVLKIHSRWAKKGAFVASPAVPKRFVVDALGVEEQPFHNASRAAIVDILSVEVEHGAHGRAFAALQAEVEVVGFRERLNLAPEIL